MKCKIRTASGSCRFPVLGTVPPPSAVSDLPFWGWPCVPRMDHEAARLEKRHVHDVYQSTAPYFSDLQSKAWPRVRQFLQEQKPGSLIADIGTGATGAPRGVAWRGVARQPIAPFLSRCLVQFCPKQKSEAEPLACRYPLYSRNSCDQVRN